MDVAKGLMAAGLDWLGWELINKHPLTLSALALGDVEHLGRGISSWGQADAFGTLIAGPAWQLGIVRDQDIAKWAHSQDRWWRRIALVATTVLNTTSRGGHGDAARTLAVAELLLHDKDAMVIKALSWSLRTLVPWEREAVRAFLTAHGPELDARIRREVGSKLETGLKVRPRTTPVNPPASPLQNPT